MLIDPNVPVTAAPTFVEAEPTTPAATPLTVLVSPASTSVSLVIALPVGFVPAVPLFTPPASTAVAISRTATGPSLTLVRLIVKLAVEKLISLEVARTVMLCEVAASKLSSVPLATVTTPVLLWIVNRPPAESSSE